MKSQNVSSQLVVAVFLLGLMGSLSAKSNQPMVDMAVNMARQNGDLIQLAQCLSLDESAIESAMRRSLDKCLRHSNVDSSNQCIESEFSLQLKVSKERLSQCGSEQDQQEDTLVLELKTIDNQTAEIERKLERLFQKETLSSAEETQMETLEQQLQILMGQQMMLLDRIARLSMSEHEKELDEIYRNLGDGEPNEAPQNRLNELHKAQIDDNTQRLQPVIQMAMDNGQKNQSQITLPVYKNSQVMMHLTEANEMTWGDQTVKTLPAATLASTDDVKSIVTFYQQQLPGFKSKELSGGEVIFMEEMPVDFDILTHMSEYTSTPHVLIRKTNSESSATPKGTQALIEIAYRR